MVKWNTTHVALAMAITLFTQFTIGSEPLLVVSLSGQQQLDAFTIDDEGKLRLQSQTSLEAAPGTSCFDTAVDFFYAGCSNPDSVIVLQVQANRLLQVQSVAVPSKPTDLAITPSGRFLIACYYATGQVTVHRILSQGRLSTEPIQTLTLEERAHGITIDRSGQFVFVPHTRPNCIDQFRMDSHSGMLTHNSPPRLERQEDIGPRHLAFHPTANFVYGSNEQGRSLSAYRFDANLGTLTVFQTVSSLPKASTEKGSTSHVEVHPSGEFVYIANRGHGSLAAFAIDSVSGSVVLLQHVSTEPVVRSFDLSPDGRFLVAAGQRSGNLRCYRISNSGTLSPSDSKPVGKAPWWVSFSPVRSDE